MRKHFYLSFLLFISFACQLNAQDTVRVDNNQYTAYEKSLNRKGTFIIEETRTLWKYKGIRIEAVVQRDQNRNILTKAMRFANRFELTRMGPENYSYLDDDEVDSLLRSLELYASMYSERSSRGADKKLIYSSRGNIYAACHVNANIWEVSLSTDKNDPLQYTYFNIKRLREFIEVIKMYKDFQPPVEGVGQEGGR
jgi:hypothetical protein